MTNVLWMLVFTQVLMGGFDTLYHHELAERLPWRPSQAGELKLHGARNLAYALLFTALGFSEPHGLLATILLVLIAAELIITLWDFLEEDRTRRLPPGERALHALLTLNYGAVLALLIPLLAQWAALPLAILPARHGLWSWLCGIAAVGVIASGLRDLAAARRVHRIRPVAAASLSEALKQRLAILVTGGTGFVGSRLVAALTGAGHDVTVLTRSQAKAAELPAPLRMITSLDQLAEDTRIDAIVNLAGEPISNGLWTARKQRRILRSRLKMTRGLLRLIRRLRTRPAVLVSGSAIGWYGLRDDETLDEASAGITCFSRSVCQRWEKAAMAADALDVRVVCLRTGLVLAAEGGMLARMLTPFELGLGGPFGAGRHWMSWIHRDDLVRLIIHAIATPTLAGPVNATAPTPVTNAMFATALGRACRRPAILPLPATLLRLALGAFAEELLLGGQRVLPRAAIESRFRFLYSKIDDALAAIVRGTGRGPLRNEPAPARLQGSAHDGSGLSPRCSAQRPWHWRSRWL
jgi:uncharacterized protein (TIGR01777 family)